MQSELSLSYRVTYNYSSEDIQYCIISKYKYLMNVTATVE